MGRKKKQRPEQEKDFKAFTDFQGFPIEQKTEYTNTLNQFLQKQKMRRVMDLSTKQKQFIGIWNNFMEKERGDTQSASIQACLNFNISLLVLRFLIENREIVRENYRLQFLLHLTTLENYKKIGKADVYYLMQALFKNAEEIQAIASELMGKAYEQDEVVVLPQGLKEGTKENPIELD